MPTKPLDRLMFAQGGRCFFCRQSLPKDEASVEHLVASANGGSNNDENCVACCKAVNALFGSMSLKEKVQVVLNQKGDFKCPNASEKLTAIQIPPTPVVVAKPSAVALKITPDKIALTISNLQQRGTSKPRRVETLTSTVSSIFKPKLTDAETQSLLKHLLARGVIKYEGTKVTYSFA